MARSLRRPDAGLDPAMFSIAAVQEWALERSRRLAPDLFRLSAIWHLDFVRQPAPAERKTRYTMKVAQAEGYGISAGPLSTLGSPAPRLVGLDAREILSERLCRDDVARTALVDLVAGHTSRPADRTIALGRDSGARYRSRARIFAAEAARVVRGKGRRALKGKRPRALVIGATAGIIGALVKRGFDVSATDLWPEAVGRKLGGVRIQNGRSANARLIAEADLAIVTGMALANRTLPGLVEMARRSGTSTIVWAITGKNLGHYYTAHGVDSVISDPSPFLHLPFPMTMGIWRRRT